AFTIFTLLAVYVGFKEDSKMVREFGATIFFINLYTKFFEHIFGHVSTAVCFFLLGISFCLIASKFEKLWLQIEKLCGKTLGEEME
ncbi:MAG: hypothetical protein LBQ23_02695, partial [Puniceicoccales bacterium]|nr:hypothetical protein [Puniceicoccales bacterium]